MPTTALIGVIGLAGFGIQQFLQLIDPVVDLVIGKWISDRTTPTETRLPSPTVTADFKKSTMGLLAFLAGLIVALTFDIHVLAAAQAAINGTAGTAEPKGLQLALDVIVSAFVIGAGTDGANTLLKYVGYVKDARGNRARIGDQATETSDIPQGVTTVGTAGRISVSYDAYALGPEGKNLANAFLSRCAEPCAKLEQIFGIPSGDVDVVISKLSAACDGSGGGQHDGCTFGTLYLDATFNNTTVDPVEYLVGLFVAELSECFMGTLNSGWTCTYSHGEGLSRVCARELTKPGTMDYWRTVPAWIDDDMPDRITQPAHTDLHAPSTGCAVAYLYWMISRGYALPQLIRAGGNLPAGYKQLTSKQFNIEDLRQAIRPLPVGDDDPFPPRA